MRGDYELSTTQHAYLYRGLYVGKQIYYYIMIILGKHSEI